ncbi:MAG: serine/threonine protein kinase [Kiritimatiellae bacterium]|nr:serine/threonine protein kinase [Kiritimatiellia bacterium]
MAENDEPMIQTPADFGHFVLEKELGHGGMGGVYLARDKMLDRRVGIKVMLKSLGADPKFVERFQREAQAAARLNHPNIAQIYSFGQEQGMPYIAMELVPGGSLDKEMESNPGTLDVVYVMRVGQQVADALALAAESGLVHGDVKPENVLFDSDGNAKLVDFGLAAMQGDSDEIWGTPFYISPEKVRRQKIDYRADIYSLGGTLYHVLTGVPPFDGPDPTAVVKARFEGPPKKPSELRPDIPPEVDAIIMRMLELEPSMRYPTYQSLLGDFKRYLAKAGPAKTTKTTGPKLKFKGMKPKVSLSATGTGNAASVDGEVADLQPIDDLGGEEEEKKSMNVGAMVGLAVGGVVLVILLVAGGLWWYMSSAKAAKEERELQLIAEKQSKARQSIQKTVKMIQEDYADFHKLVLQSDAVISQTVHDVQKAVPEELKEMAAEILSPPPLPIIDEAIAYTNRLFLPAGAVPPPAAEEKPAGTNAVESAAAEKKDGEKDSDEKKAGDKKADEGKDEAKKPDEKKADDKKADDKKPAEQKSEEKKPDDKKPTDKKA